MRKFLIHIVGFFLVLFVFIIASVVLTNRIVFINSHFKIPRNIDKVIIGHSHPECAYNDSLIPSLRNYSSSGEAYFYTYFKIKQLLNANKNIKQVFIEYTNNYVNKNMDEAIWDNKHMLNYLPIYAPFIDLESLELLFRRNVACFITGISATVRNNIWTIVHSDYDYSNKIGKYWHLVRSKTDSLLTIQKSDVEFKKSQVSETNMKYLEKIIHECRKKSVDIYLVRTPLHYQYEGLKNEKYFQDYLKTKFSNVEFLDFKNFPLSNSEFGDLEHLNHKGARRFSLFFNELLKNGLLKKEKKQDFIDEEMNKNELVAPSIKNN